MPWGLCWNVNKNISFHVRLLPRKTNKIFQTIQKTLFWGHAAILALFTQIWAKMNFPGKRFSNDLPSCEKSDKNDMPFLRKMLNLMDGWTDRQKDRHRQPWFVGPFVGQGTNHYNNFKLSWIYIKTQKPVHFINFFVRYSQFLISATRVGTPSFFLYCTNIITLTSIQVHVTSNKFYILLIHCKLYAAAVISL